MPNEKELSETLQKWGFTLNPYNRCIANRTSFSNNAQSEDITHRKKI